jgi:hypothetical protein
MKIAAETLKQNLNVRCKVVRFLGTKNLTAGILS